MHAARDLARSVEALDRLVARSHHLALRRDLETTHAVVDGRRHDRHAVIILNRRRKVVKEPSAESSHCSNCQSSSTRES